MKSYRQLCGIALALDLIGQRWTILILRELLLGPRRYSELLDALQGVTTNLLADRMKQLEAAGLVTRTKRASDERQSWALTEAGRASRPVLLEMGRFGERWMSQARHYQKNPRWFMLSLQRRYRGGLRPATVGLEIDGVPFTLALTESELSTSDGAPDAPDARLTGDLPAVVSYLSGRPGGPGSIHLDGDVEFLTELKDHLVWG